MNSQQIEREINALQKRREALESDAAEAGRALDDARAGLISGKAQVPQVTAAQSTFSALTEALATLVTRITGTREQLENARAQEERRERERKASALDKERVANAAAYDERLRRLDKHLGEEMAALVAARSLDGRLVRDMEALGAPRDIMDMEARGSARGLISGRRWSDSGLAFTRHIAQMVGEAESRERSRREQERTRQMRVQAKSASPNNSTTAI